MPIIMLFHPVHWVFCLIDSWWVLRYAPRTEFQAGGRTYRISLEALLMGHEDWVHTVCWQPTGKPAEPRRACLLSASMDRTMALWRKDTVSGQDAPLCAYKTGCLLSFGY